MWKQHIKYNNKCIKEHDLSFFNKVKIAFAGSLQWYKRNKTLLCCLENDCHC